MIKEYSDNSYLARTNRKKIVAGYSELIEEQIRWGWKPNYINFMFNQIPSGVASRMDVMTSEVTRVHDILTRHIVRRPKAVNWCYLRPIFIGCHDLPVWKHEKELVRNLEVNGGLHFNVVALVPQESQAAMPMKMQYVLWGRQSRLNVSLKKHFEQNQRFYLNDILSRIHVTPITKNTMADYTLTAYKKGLVNPDSILILK
jgi:hypothetical protein